MMDGATLLLRGRRNGPVRGDPELLHLRDERRALEPETYRRAAGSGDDTVRLTQHLDDVLPVGVVVGFGARRPRPCGPHLQRRQLEASPLRPDHRSVEDVMQVADVPGPGA